MIENTIKTIEAQVPDAVWQQARDLAARERIPLEQLISLAVTQTVGAWSNELPGGASQARQPREVFAGAGAGARRGST